MNDFANQDYPTHKLEKLNACHMYLQVTTLAELTDHTGEERLPQALLDRASPSPKGLTNISKSMLQWPNVAMLTTTCWCIWTTTICSLYTGSQTGTCLQHPLGVWTTNYDVHRFWHWRQFDATHLMFQQHADTSPRIALWTQMHRTLAKFSLTVPTMLPFQGPPVMPMDPTTGFVWLPVTCIPAAPMSTPVLLYASTIQNQFWASLPPWQRVLFGSLCKAGSTNTLLGHLATTCLPPAHTCQWCVCPKECAQWLCMDTCMPTIYNLARIWSGTRSCWRHALWPCRSIWYPSRNSIPSILRILLWCPPPSDYHKVLLWQQQQHHYTVHHANRTNSMP